MQKATVDVGMTASESCAECVGVEGVSAIAPQHPQQRTMLPLICAEGERFVESIRDVVHRRRSTVRRLILQCSAPLTLAQRSDEAEDAETSAAS